MNKYSRIATIVTAISLMTALFNIAQAEPIILKSATGINFINGGIGREEVETIRKVAKKFPLQLLFSEGKAGRALTDIGLAITDSNGATVFTLKKAGPLLYIDLPAGKYKVTGNYNGAKQSHLITLVAGEKPQKLYLNWKAEVPEDAIDPTDNVNSGLSEDAEQAN